jgi:hypothetical protein
MRFNILILGLFSSTAFAQTGTWQDLVRSGERAAYQIIESFESADLDVSSLKEADVEARVRGFYTDDIRTKLLDEASNATIEIVAENANGACGQTEQSEHAIIYLSEKACPKDIRSVAAMARLLIGEYVHHLGHGDEFTDWVKSSIMATYAKLDAEAFSEMAAETLKPAAPRDWTYKELIGNVYFTVRVEDALLLSFAHDGKLHFTTPKKLSETVELTCITQRAVRWDSAKKAFVSVGEWVITGYENRYWGQGLYERYPVFFRKNFNFAVRPIGDGSTVELTYDVPVRVDLVRNDVVMKTVTKSMTREAKQEVFDALFKKNK